MAERYIGAATDQSCHYSVHQCPTHCRELYNPLGKVHSTRFFVFEESQHWSFWLVPKTSWRLNNIEPCVLQHKAKGLKLAASAIKSATLPCTRIWYWLLTSSFFHLLGFILSCFLNHFQTGKALSATDPHCWSFWDDWACSNSAEKSRALDESQIQPQTSCSIWLIIQCHCLTVGTCK